MYLFWLCWVFIAACELSVVAASGGYSLVGMHPLLIVVASLVAEHRLLGMRAQSLWHTESSWTRDRTHVPGIGRWILNHWTTSEVPSVSFLIVKFKTLSGKFMQFVDFKIPLIVSR